MTRSPSSLPSFLRSAFQVLTNFRKPKIKGQVRPTLSGLSTNTIAGRNYDLEISEPIVRNNENGNARDIVEMVSWCPEARLALSKLVRNTFSSMSGDDQGWTVSDVLSDNETPIHPDIKRVCIDLIEATSDGESIIGGRAFHPVLWEALAWGDSFPQLAIGKDGLGSYGIQGMALMPPWTMFTVKDYVNPTYYEQRLYLTQEDVEIFDGLTVCQVSYNRRRLYGNSIYAQSVDKSIGDWQGLKDALFDLAKASRAIAVNPNLHTLPEGAGVEDKEAYKEELALRRDDEIITDFVLLPGHTIAKLGSSEPTLKGITDRILLHRQRIIQQADIPMWAFSGMTVGSSGRDTLSEAREYARFINDLRGMLSEHLTHILKLECILRLGYDRFIEYQGDLIKIKFPVFWAEYQQSGVQEDGEDTPDGNNPDGNEGETELDLIWKPKTGVNGNGGR